MRLFFAVTLSPKVRAVVGRVQQELRAETGDDGVKWEKPDKFHYTLQFLGETPSETLARVTEAAQAVAAQIAPFVLTLSGLGAFSNERRPQILWLGVSEGVPLLTRLAQSLQQSLVAKGVEPDRARFVAHLTLARAKSRGGEIALARTLAEQKKKQNGVDKIDVLEVESFVLMCSELRPTGSVYTVQETFALAGSATGFPAAPSGPLPSERTQLK